MSDNLRFLPEEAAAVNMNSMQIKLLALASTEAQFGTS
jgi:hypothetical protein